MRNNLYNPTMPDVSRTGRMVFGGGGGSREPVTKENIPEWARPYYESALGEIQTGYEAGDFGHVEGLTDTQTQGIEGLKGAAAAADNQYNVGVAGQDIYGQQARGEGIFSAANTDALKQSAIADAQKAFGGTQAAISGSGGVGGARAGILGADRDAQLANQFAQFDYDALRNQQNLQSTGADRLLSSSGQLSGQASTGADLLLGAGDREQAQAQAEGDKRFQELQRLSGLLTGTTPGVTHVQQGGK